MIAPEHDGLSACEVHKHKAMWSNYGIIYAGP